MSMTLVQTYTVPTNGVVNFTISNIPQTGKDLMILWSARSETSAASIDFIPNTTGFSGNERRIDGNGSNVSSGTSFNPRMTVSSDTSNTFGNGMVYFPNYTSSQTKIAYHDNVTENAGTTAWQQFGTMTQSTTAPITAMFIRGNGGQDINQNSTFSLYIIS
jgi:hypothetical protein